MNNRKKIVVQITSGTAPGPYSIYTTSILDENLLDSNISLSDLSTGKTYFIDTSITTILLVNKDSNCCCSTQTISV